jgi:hypothetical protein
MKKLLSVIAIVSMVLLSFNAHSRLSANGIAANGSSLNGVSVNSADQILNLRSLAQAPLVKAP